MSTSPNLTRPPQPSTWRTFVRLFPHLSYFTVIEELRRILRGCDSCLEIGCGESSPARSLNFERYVGVDGYAPMIDRARINDPSGEYHFVRAEDMGEMFAPKEFDCVIALDLIEHLEKEDGLKLIETMTRLAKKKVVLFTPNGFLPQVSQDGDLQEHLSGWEVQEMRDLGFQVIGMLGPKALRGAFHLPKIRPSVIGGTIAQTAQLVTRWVPQWSAAIYCVRTLNS